MDLPSLPSPHDAMQTLGGFALAFACTALGVVARQALAMITIANANRLADMVTRAGLMGASVAAGKIREAIERARQADSDGGATITNAEARAALSLGLAAGLDFIRNSNLWEQMIALFAPPNPLAGGKSDGLISGAVAQKRIEEGVREKMVSNLAKHADERVRKLATGAWAALAFLIAFGLAAPALAGVTKNKSTVVTGSGTATAFTGQKGCGVLVSAISATVARVGGVETGTTVAATIVGTAICTDASAGCATSYMHAGPPAALYYWSSGGAKLQVTFFEECTAAASSPGMPVLASGGGLAGTGTSGTYAKFTGTGSVGNALLTESGSTISTNAADLSITSGDIIANNATTQLCIGSATCTAGYDIRVTKTGLGGAQPHINVTTTNIGGVGYLSAENSSGYSVSLAMAGALGSYQGLGNNEGGLVGYGGNLVIDAEGGSSYIRLVTLGTERAYVNSRGIVMNGNSIVLGNIGSAPGAPLDGQVYYDTGTSKTTFREGGAWVTYALAGSGLSGSGTINTVAKWTSSSGLGNSSFTDNGSLVSFSMPIVVGSGATGGGYLSTIGGSGNTDYYFEARNTSTGTLGLMDIGAVNSTGRGAHLEAISTGSTRAIWLPPDSGILDLDGNGGGVILLGSNTAPWLDIKLYDGVSTFATFARFVPGAAPKLTIGSTTATAMLNVGSAAQFQVSSAGAVTAPNITNSALPATGIIYAGTGGLLTANTNWINVDSGTDQGTQLLGSPSSSLGHYLKNSTVSTAQAYNTVAGNSTQYVQILANSSTYAGSVDGLANAGSAKLLLNALTGGAAVIKSQNSTVPLSFVAGGVVGATMGTTGATYFPVAVTAGPNVVTTTTTDPMAIGWNHNDSTVLRISNTDTGNNADVGFTVQNATHSGSYQLIGTGSVTIAPYVLPDSLLVATSGINGLVFRTSTDNAGAHIHYVMNLGGTHTRVGYWDHATGGLNFGLTGTTTGIAQFSGATSGTVTVKSADATDTYTLTLPLYAPTLSGDVMATTDTAGTLRFRTIPVNFSTVALASSIPVVDTEVDWVGSPYLRAATITGTNQYVSVAGTGAGTYDYTVTDGTHTCVATYACTASGVLSAGVTGTCDMTGGATLRVHAGASYGCTTPPTVSVVHVTGHYR